MSSSEENLQKRRISYKEEQLLVIVTSVMSIVTAGLWSDVIETVFENYLGDSLVYRMIYAFFMSGLTVFLIDWLITNSVNDASDEEARRKKEHMRNFKVSNYVRNIFI